MVQIENEKIIINGKETFLFGGELHYFRVPRENWKQRIRDVKEAGANLISTYVPWIFHEIEEGLIDLTGKTRAERDLAAFLKLVAEEEMYCLVRPGPYVMAEVVDHGVPTWFIDNYPEAVAKTNEGSIHPTRVVSYMHPVFLEKVDIWYKAVCEIIVPFQVTNGGPVIMFQLDNEVGMFHWVTNQPDFNTETLKQFHRYLLEKYTKKDFESTFNVPFESIEELSLKKIKKPEPGYAHALRNEFGLFLRLHYRSFLERLKGYAESNGINVPYVVNIHGFHTVDLLKRGTMYPIGISQLLEAAKIENVLVAGDYYIGNIEYDNYIDIVMANAFTRAIQWKEQPLFSAEFQGGSIHDVPRLQPTTFDLTTRLCVADGMNAVNYYMFASGENYENIGLFGKRHDWQAPLGLNGEKRPHYEVIRHLGGMFGVYGKQLLNAAPVSDLHIGFYPDYYMTEFYDEHTKAMVDEIQEQREAFLYNGLVKSLRLNNYIFEAWNVMEGDRIDPEQVSTLWMFSTKWMDEDIQKKLVRYMEEGGTLVLFPVLPTKTLKNVPCTILKDYAGVEVSGHFKEGFATIGSIDNVSVKSMETYDVHEGVFAWSEEETPKPIAFEKNLGNGKLIMLGAAIKAEFNYQNRIASELAQRAGITNRFGLDDELDITVRSGSLGDRFFFIENFDEYKKYTSISYFGVPLIGGKKLEIAARSGLMLPLHVDLTDDIKILYGTGEIFQLQEDEEKLTATLKIMQKEEEFLFSSSSWIADETSQVKVEIGEYESFKVFIRSPEETAEITFRKRLEGGNA
ncbi:beta-galactosidase [Bacillus sp. FJAT-27445]|uniref:beta-galactosidase n=1 Tax=Bacillus sp. FJAT-27445 TaxID=1679166 RepID=UPI000743C580|nr:beta-galactosidase [Bacillus sp. FJAT-27445]